MISFTSRFVLRLSPLLAVTAIGVVLAWAAMAARDEPGTTAGASRKFAGTYKIDGWQDLESRGLYHFFYLHPSGQFLLAGYWAGREKSRIAGRWSVEGQWIMLSGMAHVETNQGQWRVPFKRAFRVDVGREGFELRPRPDKNRYGLLGWPNPYFYYRAGMVDNIPDGTLPVDERALLALIDRISSGN